MNASYDFARADRVTVGTVGPVGHRVFLLQARQGTDLVTLKVEKQQVSVLADYLGRLLDQVGRPATAAPDVDLEEPAEPEWVVGTLGIAYDEDDDIVVLVAEEVGQEGEDDEEDEEDDDGAVARFGLTREQAAALAARGTRLVEAGRPPCPLCGFPLDPEGHSCPKKNGSRPPTT